MTTPDVTALDVTTSFARTLVDEWARAGVTHAVVSPGSRNTPLTLALERDERITVDVVLDERSAGFRALGAGLARGRPAVVCCTSGTAAVNLHPAVVEAHHARVPLVVCTADRPPELHDVGAGQTIEQQHLFGRVVRWFHDPGPPELTPDADARWRTVAGRAIAAAIGPPAGPVHVNLPFREPLVPTGAPLVDAPGRADGAPWLPIEHAPTVPAAAATIDRIADLVRARPRGLLVAGFGACVHPETAARLAAATGWPILADPLSGLRTGEHAVSTYDALLRCDPFAAAQRPEIVLRVGAPLTSKVASAWLDGAGAPTVLIDPDDVWLDPQRTATDRVVAGADATVNALVDVLGDKAPADDAWTLTWRAAERVARRALDSVLDEDVACDARIARDVAASLPEGGGLVVASSLPVRALEWSMAPRADVSCFANRGANGIDGFVSTAVGIARARVQPNAPTVALSGDLCFLHDTNGLLGVGSETNLPLTFVVIDNDGGAIFSYLPQHGLAEFERLFATPPGVDLVAVARAHGVAAERVTRVGDLTGLLAARTDTVRVLVVDAPRDHAADQHRRCWDAVATALS